MVLELLSGDQTLAQVATKHEVTPISLKAWKKQFLENASMAFDLGIGHPELQGRDCHLEERERCSPCFSQGSAVAYGQLNAQRGQRAKKLGKTTIERDWAVGKLKSYSLAQAASRLSAALLSPSRLRYTPTRGA